MDCTESGKDTCGKYGVSGYPTLKIFRNGEFASEYNGPRESSMLCIIFIKQVLMISEDVTY